MAVWLTLLLAAAMELPAAELETLKGEKHAGSLVELSDSGVRLRQGETEISVPLAELLELRLPSTAVPDPSTGARVMLLDGTRLTCSEFSVKNDKARLESPLFGSLELPVSRLAHVRFGISTKPLDEMWDKLLARDSKNDLLVVKKEDVLDFLTGVTGDVGEKINFLTDGDEIPVGREKVYGLIFRRRAPGGMKPTAELALLGGDLLQVAEAAWNGTAFKVKLAVGPQVTLAPDKVLALDYSAGKVKYLSQLEPRDVKYVPFFDLVHEYRRDRSLDGPPISLWGKTYARGLAIHSRTLLKYRIGGDYSRFQAVMGIDDALQRKGQVKVVISGDGKTLFEGEVYGKDAPRTLDLNVTGVRDLDILVDFGGDMRDICDHLDLADAKVVK